MKDIKIRKRSRIVFDTNIWISFLIGKQISNLENYIINYELIVLYSDILLDEIKETLQKPKLKKYIKKESFDDIQSIFLAFGELNPVTSTIEICRDKKDDFLLNLCIDAKSNFLITGDKDLLEIKKIKKTEIITYKQFQELCQK